MRNILLSLKFNGSRYHGFQFQKNAVAVGDVFQKALTTVLGHYTDIKGCSRTDTGVHANMFCVSFTTDNPIPCHALIKGLNINLPPDIAVFDCKEVPEDFHARYSSTGKRYLYKVLNSTIKDPFLENLAHPFYPPIDAEQLDRAARQFIGTYDFSGFSSTGGKPRESTRTIYDFRVWREGDLVLFSVTGNGFLYNMVRILVGTLLAISMGKIEETAIPVIIASKDRERAGPTAPACGLYLDYVHYEPIEN